jgi:hypothetical protein
MLATGSEMFLFIPNESNTRTLHPGKVIESTSDAFVGQFEEAILPEVFASVNAFGEVDGKFFQQAAIVTELRQELPVPIIAFSRAGEPVSAENREIFRVCVAMAGISAKVEREDGCSVMDISPVGLAAMAATEHKLGTDVRVAFHHEAWTVSTGARVQTVKPRPDGRYRYGLLAFGKNTEAHKALQQISMSMQKQQLRRLAGAA